MQATEGSLAACVVRLIRKPRERVSLHRSQMLAAIISAINEIISLVENQQDHGLIGLDAHAKLFRGLADPARLGILLLLREGPSSAGELARGCGLIPSNASNHLRCLLDCGLVTLEPQGRRNIYRLSDVRVDLLLAASSDLMSSPAAALVHACCNYGSMSRRALRSAASKDVTLVPS